MLLKKGREGAYIVSMIWHLVKEMRKKSRRKTVEHYATGEKKKKTKRGGGGGEQLKKVQRLRVRTDNLKAHFFPSAVEMGLHAAMGIRKKTSRKKKKKRGISVKKALKGSRSRGVGG